MMLPCQFFLRLPLFLDSCRISLPKVPVSTLTRPNPMSFLLLAIFNKLTVSLIHRSILDLLLPVSDPYNSDGILYNAIVSHEIVSRLFISLQSRCLVWLFWSRDDDEGVMSLRSQPDTCTHSNIVEGIK